MTRVTDLPSRPADAHQVTTSAAPRHLLILRFVLVNAVAAGLAGAVWLEGWLDAALRGYTLWLTAIIMATFGYGVVLCARQVAHTSNELAVLADGNGAHCRTLSDYRTLQAGAREPALAAQLLRLRLSGDIALVQHLANALVFLGLVGTVIGFIVALSGVQPDFAGDAQNVAPMVATLVEGMSIALYTTLIGAITHLWLTVDYRLLAGGVTRLYSAVLTWEAGRDS